MEILKTQLSPEEETIQLLGNPLLREKQKARLEELLLKDMNYPHILGLLHLHRIEGIAWNNIKEHIIGENRKFKFGFLFKMLQRYHNVQVQHFNEQKIEIEEAVKVLNQNDIPFVILKGISISDHVYPVSGMRISNDCDILVHPDYLQTAITALEGSGYVQGYYDSYKQKVIEATRKDKIASIMRSHEAIPLYKVKEDFIALNYFAIDLQFTIDLMTSNRRNDVLDEFFERKIYLKNIEEFYPALSWEDSLLFLCVHFYVEATIFEEVQNYKDFAIYKIADIYLLLATRKFELDFSKIVEAAKRHKLEKAVYFTFYYLSLFYELEFDFLNDFEIQDEAFLDQVIKKDKVIHTWDTDRLSRFFDFDRLKSLKEEKNI